MYTAAETQQQVALVEALMTQGVPRDRIMTEVARRTGCTLRRAERISVRVRARWEREDVEERRVWRTSQIRRLHGYLRLAQGYDPVTGQRTGKVQHSAIAKYEELLAAIQGTKAPLQIDVNVQYTDAMMVVLANMDHSDVAKLVDEGRRMERALLTTGESVEDAAAE